MFEREPWRFRYMLGAAVCAGILFIAVTGKLGLYIHPRYHIFTIVLCVLGLIINIIASIRYDEYPYMKLVKHETHVEVEAIDGRWLLGGKAWFVVIIVMLLVWSPRVPLSSATADKKFDTSTRSTSGIEFAPWYNSPGSIYQLSRVIDETGGRSKQVGRSFSFTGFVRAQPANNPDVFSLSRFIISCCAVDATPASVPVYFENWQNEFQIDEWVSVDGQLQVRNVDGKPTAVLQGNVARVVVPEQPYDYLY